jgi:hypothetical protein
MKTILVCLTAVIFFMMSCTNQASLPSADGNVFNGKWTYRSLKNDKNVNTAFNDLEFAAATITLNSVGVDSVKGTILWAMDSAGTIFNGLNLAGKYYSIGDSTTGYFLEGKGDSLLGTKGWQYNYQGYVLAHWANGIDQAKVLVGSVVRVKKHSCDSSGNNCSPAGFVASTYMVKQ